jgi:hypothetical protein
MRRRKMDEIVHIDAAGWARALLLLRISGLGFRVAVL